MVLYTVTDSQPKLFPRLARLLLLLSEGSGGKLLCLCAPDSSGAGKELFVETKRQEERVL